MNILNKMRWFIEDRRSFIFGTLFGGLIVLIPAYYPIYKDFTAKKPDIRFEIGKFPQLLSIKDIHQGESIEIGENVIVHEFRIQALITNDSPEDIFIRNLFIILDSESKNPQIRSFLNFDKSLDFPIIEKRNGKVFEIILTKEELKRIANGNPIDSHVQFQTTTDNMIRTLELQNILSDKIFMNNDGDFYESELVIDDETLKRIGESIATDRHRVDFLQVIEPKKE